MIKINQKIAIVGLLISGYSVAALGDCVSFTNYYTKCKPRYYLTNHTCKLCPVAAGTSYATGAPATPTSPEDNTGDITSCYLLPGEYKDSTGFFSITDNCNYSSDRPPAPPSPPSLD